LHDPLEAYLASKIVAFKATKDFMSSHQPAYDVINILPGYFVGREELATKAKDLLLGTNRVVLGQFLGLSAPKGLPSTSVLIEDVAKAHVLSLNRSVPGNQSFVISSDGLQGTTWADAIEIVSNHFSKDTIEAAGFKLDGGGTPTNRILIDSTHTQETLGMKFKPYREQVLSIVSQYFELSGLKDIESKDEN
jgi:nucleoside-diphosphate-sugar epimerase